MVGCVSYGVTVAKSKIEIFSTNIFVISFSGYGDSFQNAPKFHKQTILYPETHTRWDIYLFQFIDGELFCNKWKCSVWWQ